MSAVVQWLARSYFPSWELGWGLIFSSPVVFQTCWHNECKTLVASSFRDLTISAGITFHPLALLTAMFLGQLNQVNLLTSSRPAETWAWPPWGKHGLWGLTHLPRLLPPTVRFIPCHTLICVTDPFSFTDIVSHIYFLILSQSTITHSFSLIFLCHSIILFPSHLFSLTSYLS